MREVSPDQITSSNAKDMVATDTSRTDTQQHSDSDGPMYDCPHEDITEHQPILSHNNTVDTNLDQFPSQEVNDSDMPYDPCTSIVSHPLQSRSSSSSSITHNDAAEQLHSRVDMTATESPINIQLQQQQQKGYHQDRQLPSVIEPSYSQTPVGTANVLNSIRYKLLYQLSSTILEAMGFTSPDEEYEFHDFLDL
jgi:hypothetical protein